MQTPQPTPPPLYAGLAGMAAANPADVAREVFLRVFTPTKTHYDVREVHGILQDLSGQRELSGRDVRALFSTYTAMDALDPFYLQCVLIWERALIGARLSRGSENTSHFVVLLPRGWQALVGPDPVGAVRAILSTPIAPVPD